MKKRIFAFIMLFVVIVSLFVTNVSASPAINEESDVMRYVIFDYGSDYEPYPLTYPYGDIVAECGFLYHLFGEEYYEMQGNYQLEVPLCDGSYFYINIYNQLVNISHVKTCYVQGRVVTLNNPYPNTFPLGTADVVFRYDSYGSLWCYEIDVSDNYNYSSCQWFDMYDISIPSRLYESDAKDDLIIEGFVEGNEAGYIRGLEVGRNEGFSSAYTEGYTTGYNDCKEQFQDDSYDIAYNEGYAKGRKDGYNAGLLKADEKKFDVGYEIGWADGYNQGYDEGGDDAYRLGYESGVSDGSSKAYTEGFAAGQDSNLIAGTAINGFFNGLSNFFQPFFAMGIGNITVYNMIALALIALLAVIIIKMLGGNK